MKSSTAPLLVLGTSGFLGRAVVERAVARGPRRPLVAAGPHPFAPAGAVARPVDGRERGAVRALLDAERPGAVLLVAALARGGDCEREPGLAAALNVELPDEVARWCASAHVRLVHVSTDLVFGHAGARAGGRRESDPVGAPSVYGRTKAAGERAVLDACPSALVARLPLLCGDSRGRGLGASDSLIAALARGEEPVLFDDEWRTPLDVDVAAAALVRLVASTASGIIHLPGRERVSRAELGRRVVHRSEIDSSRLRVAPRAALGLADARPADVCLAGERARLVLGDDWNRVP